jgi:Na+(H+)/acetate symporter ActP
MPMKLQGPRALPLRDFSPGLSALLIAAVIAGVLTALRVRHQLNIADLSGLVIAVALGSLGPILFLLVLARIFHAWPFSN